MFARSAQLVLARSAQLALARSAQLVLARSTSVRVDRHWASVSAEFYSLVVDKDIDLVFGLEGGEGVCERWES